MSDTTAVTIETLHCNEPSETGHDEVYMTVSVDGNSSSRYPSDGSESMGKGDDWQINQTYNFASTCKVEFWDSDFPSDDDYLGGYTFTPTSDTSSPISLSGSGGSYELYFSLS